MLRFYCTNNATIDGDFSICNGEQYPIKDITTLHDKNGIFGAFIIERQDNKSQITGHLWFEEVELYGYIK